MTITMMMTTTRVSNLQSYQSVDDDDFVGDNEVL